MHRPPSIFSSFPYPPLFLSNRFVFFWVRCRGNGVFMLLSQVIVQSLNSTEVIGMHVREDDLAHNSSFGKQIVNARSQSLLLFLVRRSGIDYKKVARGVNQITIRMRRRRQGLGA